MDRGSPQGFMDVTAAVSSATMGKVFTVRLSIRFVLSFTKKKKKKKKKNENSETCCRP
jgi:hypothetical protein